MRTPSERTDARTRVGPLRSRRLGPPYIAKFTLPSAEHSAQRHASAEVQLFADGACSGNPGPGGWAFILRHPATGKEMEALRRRAGNDQQPHGVDGRDPRPGGPQTADPRGVDHRQQVRGQRLDASGCPSGRPTAGGAARASSRPRSRTRTSGGARRVVGPAPAAVYPRPRPQRPPGERALRRPGRGSVSQADGTLLMKRRC